MQKFIHSILEAIRALFNKPAGATGEPAHPTTSPSRRVESETAVSPPTGIESAARSEANSLMKVHNKIGFHTGPGGNAKGIGDYMKALDQAGIRFMIKSVDSYGPLFEASQLAKKSGVDHILVYRLSTVGQNHRYDYDVPPYKDPKYVNDPEGGAVKHWEETKKQLPPEFDKARTWIEPINEVDKNLCDWLGRFAVHLANLAQQDGYKVSLFAWSSGEPEPSGWEEPGMLAYLRLCAERPKQAAVALHEYSYTVDNIFDQFPFKVGRFQALFDVCDRHGIARPTIHITEWGWTLNNVPPPEKALPDIEEVGKLYSKYPQIEGAAIWYLGPSFGDIANKAQKLIDPVKSFTVNNHFEVEFDIPAPVQPGDGQPDRVIGLPPGTAPIPVDESGTNNAPSEPVNPTRHEGSGESSSSEVATGQPAPVPGGIFVADVTIPDDTRLSTGETFKKVWQVKNTGNVTWGAGYHFVHVAGRSMTTNKKRPLPAAKPGETVVIEITFTVPDSTGIHFSDWRFQAPDGTFFGDIVYVRIIAEKSRDQGINNSMYVADLTIPDDMEVAAGQKILKTWRVRNNGTRTWGPESKLVFIEGIPMTSQLSQPLPIVSPGQTVDISLKLTAPTKPGIAYCDWRMQDDKGLFFGQVLYMRIKVVERAAEDPDPIIDDDQNDPVLVSQLQTGMNVNPDAPHSNPVDSDEFKGLDWVRFVFKLAARVNVSERDDLAAAFKQYDQLIENYARMGVKSLIVLNQETVWGRAPWQGSQNWEAYAIEFAHIAGQIAARYAPYKDRVAFEIWNEGDLDHNVASVFVPPVHFARILGQSAAAIRQNAPQAKRIFGGLATGPQTAVRYLNDVRAALGNELPVEGIGIHPYGRWGTKAPFDWGQKFGTLSESIAEYKQGTNGIPLWITEIGVAADGEIGPQYYSNIAEYMRDLYRTTQARHLQEVPVLIWFAWSDFMRNAGIVTKDGRRKSAVYAAFQDVRERAL